MELYSIPFPIQIRQYMVRPNLYYVKSNVHNVKSYSQAIDSNLRIVKSGSHSVNPIIKAPIQIHKRSDLKCRKSNIQFPMNH